MAEMSPQNRYEPAREISAELFSALLYGRYFEDIQARLAAGHSLPELDTLETIAFVVKRLWDEGNCLPAAEVAAFSALFVCGYSNAVRSGAILEGFADKSNDLCLAHLKIACETDWGQWFMSRVKVALLFMHGFPRPLDSYAAQSGLLAAVADCLSKAGSLLKAGQLLPEEYAVLVRSIRTVGDCIVDNSIVKEACRGGMRGFKHVYPRDQSGRAMLRDAIAEPVMNEPAKLRDVLHFLATDFLENRGLKLDSTGEPSWQVDYSEIPELVRRGQFPLLESMCRGDVLAEFRVFGLLTRRLVDLLAKAQESEGAWETFQAFAAQAHQAFGQRWERVVRCDTAFQIRYCQAGSPITKMLDVDARTETSELEYRLRNGLSLLTDLPLNGRSATIDNPLRQSLVSVVRELARRWLFGTASGQGPVETHDLVSALKTIDQVAPQLLQARDVRELVIDLISQCHHLPEKSGQILKLMEVFKLT